MKLRRYTGPTGDASQLSRRLAQAEAKFAEIVTEGWELLDNMSARTERGLKDLARKTENTLFKKPSSKAAIGAARAAAWRGLTAAGVVLGGPLVAGAALAYETVDSALMIKDGALYVADQIDRGRSKPICESG